MSKITLILSGIIILVLIVLPGFIKRYAVNNSKELVGRQLQIDKLKYNYFTSTVSIYDFKMLEQDEKDNFVSFDTLILNLEPLQLFKDKVVIEEFFLKGLDITVIMRDSLFNFDDLIEFYATEEDSIPNNTDEEAFKFSISNINFKESGFHFNNQNIKQITDIEDLSFSIPFIGWDQEEKSNADVKFNFPRGGYFESKFNFNPIDGAYDADITISDLHLDPFYKYVEEYAEINSFKGVVNSNIHLEGNTNQADKTIVSGHINLSDFEMTDTNDKKFLSAKNIGAEIQKIDYYNSSYVINSLKIDDSYTFFQLDSITNNFYTIFKLDENTESTQEENQLNAKDSISNDNELYYAINHFEINKGVVDYTDNLTGKSFNYHLSNIEIESDSIFSDSEWIALNADMLLNNRGTLVAELGTNPSNPYYTNLDFTIEKFLLSDLNIYTKHYMGHNILKGDMYYYSNSIISNGKIKSDNKLLVKNVTLSNTKGGLYSLPLKFAIFLLKDKNGDVNLELPVRGDMNDPTLNVGKLVWNTFKNLIGRAVASPGRLLSGLVGGDPKDIEEINFNYLDTIPSDKNKKQLNKLLELEQKKEGLKIEMAYYVDKQLQQESVAKDEAGKIYFNETQKDYLTNKVDFETFILNKTVADSLDIKQSYKALTNPLTIDSIAKNNTELLLSNIKTYLKTVNDSTQIKINISDPKAPENVGSTPKLKVDFSMLDTTQE
ncbi:MAG: DUF748 domain-containing protein [Flavobacteriaceae bacterium]|nr:DUF748 domain-containing protein [Flavobacteriaceae bacterium]